MEFNLKLGLEAITEKIVTEEDTAAKFGSGDIKVFASPMMIGIMENAALKAVQKDLSEGFTTVGTHVDVSHIGATPVGMKVTAKAKLIKIEGKKLTFEVEAYDEKKKIGEGIHIRYIINIDRFFEKLK